MPAARRQPLQEPGPAASVSDSLPAPSHTVEHLAHAVHLSARQLNRLFLNETGKSPARVIERLRLEAARLMIEKSRLPLEVIARESGFRDRRHMRNVFMRGYGIPPQSLRTGKGTLAS